MTHERAAELLESVCVLDAPEMEEAHWVAVEVLRAQDSNRVKIDAIKHCMNCGNYGHPICHACETKTGVEPTKWVRKTEKEYVPVNKTEYSEQFDKERKYRVEVSFHKYGSAVENFGSGRVDALKTAELCIDAFKRDHNTEHLVDAANYLMFRYMYPMPGEFFKATDSSGSVGTVGTPVNMER